MNKHRSNNSRPIKFIFTILLLLLLPVSLDSRPTSSPVSYTDEDLFNMGLDAYNQRSWVNAAVYLFAYVQRDPQALSDATHAAQVQAAYSYAVDRINTAVTEYQAQIAAAQNQPGRAVRGVEQVPRLDRPTGRARTPESNAKRCVMYSRLAITQNELATEHNCGFRGPRWSSVYDHHYNWCVARTDDMDDFETSERQKQLRACSARPTRMMVRPGAVQP